MTKYIKINEELNIKCNKQIKEYLSPDYIYIPYNKNDILNIKDKEIINKNSIILASSGKLIYSPVSGTIVGACDNIVDGVKAKTIVIENNFKEATAKLSSKNTQNLTKEELTEKIKKYSAFFGSLDGITMVINGIDLEPYEETYSYLIQEHTDQILECIDSLINILNIHKCFFAIKNNDSSNVETLVNQIGTYPNIELKLMPDIYPMGHKKVLINELVLPSKINDGVVYLTVEDVYNIYNVIRRNGPITEKLVTITGNLLNKSKVVNAKIGTRIADIIENEFKITNENYHIIINGLLSGYEIDTLNAIITPNIRSIFINELKKCPKAKCINCGLCHINCPVKADPRTKYNMDKCIRCGLCNYICPSKIKLVGEQNE